MRPARVALTPGDRRSICVFDLKNDVVSGVIQPSYATVIMSAKAAAELAKAGKKIAPACVSAPLKPGWQWFTGSSGAFAGGLSALTGLGGAVVFVPACSHLGMTAKKIVGTTVVAVTCATTAGSYAYTQNNVTDIPAAFAIGIVGAATTPFGQMIAKGVSGWGSFALTPLRVELRSLTPYRVLIGGGGEGCTHHTGRHPLVFDG
jgi:hypothetical protein